MNIVICDDEPVVRGRIRNSLLNEGTHVRIREVASTADLSKEKDMDLLFLGIPLEQAGGIEAARWQREDGTEVPVIYVTAIKEDETFIFRTKKKNYSLKADQIFYAENAGKKIILHTAQENIVIYGTMKELENWLGDRFYRCHRGYLVNLAHIRGYRGDSIQIDNGDSIFLSRERYSEFVRCYLDFLGS